MAAWEFAAGRYPHPLATAFCVPLLGLGALACPRRSFRAFVRGRASTTLYRRGLAQAELDAPLADLRRALLPHTAPRPAAGDVLAYAAWVAVSLASLVLAPALVAWGAIAWT